jgi:molybdate transport system substrate-binding protein
MAGWDVAANREVFRELSTSTLTESLRNIFRQERRRATMRCGALGLCLACFCFPARAQNQLVVIAPRGIRGVVEQLLPAFERRTGQKVHAEFTSGGEVTARILRGDPFDLVILHAPFPEEIASGNIQADSARNLASAALGIAVRKGAPLPDIRTEAALRRTLLSVASIAVPGAGGATAGPIFDGVLQKLGITAQIKPRVRLVASGDAAMEMVAKGEAEIGVTYVSEMNQPGISAVGAVPRDLAEPALYAGVTAAHTVQPAAARALLEFLASPEAAVVYTEQRMQPQR